MAEAYTHHHLSQAHHSGLIIGTVIGSCAVTTLAAIAIIATKPGSVLHPLTVITQLTGHPETTNNPQPGVAAKQAPTVFPATHSSAGAADRLASPTFRQ